VESDLHITDAGIGPDLAASVRELRSKARRQGYIVEDGHTVEDWRSDTEKDARYGERGKIVEINGYLVLRYSD
jgi:hypothetical protein